MTTSRRPVAPAAYLSDLDGTLLFSHLNQERAWTWFASLHGLDPRPFLDALGRTAVEKIQRFAPHLDVETEAGRIADYETEDTDGVLALPGARDLLTSERRVAIVTSATRPLAVARLHAAGLPVPGILVTAESVACGKPNPAAFEMGAALLGVPVSACVVLEDAPAGVRAGRAALAGEVVGFPTTATAESLLQAGADRILPNVGAYLTAMEPC